jgi:phospholipid-binding lipoprotein MlaA
MKLLCAIVCSFSITSASGAFAGSPADQSYLDSLIDSASSALINAAVSALTPDVEAGASQHTATMVTETDPFETYNRWMFEFNSSLDQNALQPVAQNYRRYTPAIVQQGVSNFFSNLGDVGVVTNAVLQGKFEQALSDTARLAINSVAGIGGVIDVASMLDY